MGSNPIFGKTSALKFIFMFCGSDAALNYWADTAFLAPFPHVDWSIPATILRVYPSPAEQWMAKGKYDML